MRKCLCSKWLHLPLNDWLTGVTLSLSPRYRRYSNDEKRKRELVCVIKRKNEEMRSSTHFFVVFVFLCLIHFAHSLIQVNPSTQMFVDEHNRTRIFHGVNAVEKVFPFYPVLDRFDSNRSLCQQDFTNLKTWGFNVVRLYLAWPGFEPQRGQYNFTYLDQLNKIVDMAAQNDMYIILDMHQDVFSRKFCGEGFPDWATLGDDIESFPFPVPISVQKDKDGIPIVESCLKHSFFMYYFSKGASSSFQKFYENQDGILDAFASMWQQVAKYFAKSKNVLAYEILNEPWPGDYLKHPELLLPLGTSDKKYLMPLYSKVNDYIRKVDDDHIIMFEPIVSDFSIVGLEHGPSGSKDYLNREAFSYHIYCVDADSHGDPKSRAICKLFDDGMFRWRHSTIQKLGSGAFLTEFGAVSNATAGSHELRWMTEQADKELRSWAYWQFKFYDDVTTQSSPPTIESFYGVDGSLQFDKVKTLSRTYAHAVCGVPTSMNFDASTSLFSLVYSSVNCQNQPTIVYLNEQWYYPRGFSVSVHTKSGASVRFDKVKQNYLHFTHSPQVREGDWIEIVITAQ